ncbi:LCP family protein [Streptomyces boninensis]|uniref:LCP family protein n=1 Tax=Streptomyces boninensis TaxID=2039455 RepID=UPI003B21EC53
MTDHRKPRPQRSTRRKVVLISAWVLTVAVLLGGATFGYVYFKLNGNLSSVDVDAKLGTDRPDDADNGSMDILVLGSDSRTGENGKIGGGNVESGARSDTAMVVHLYEDRKKASIVSIPRDTMVSRPECEQDNGKMAPAAQRVMFNSAYTTGGPACSIKTVEQMTDIHIDHFVEVDFSGFKDLIDQLGGVEVTTKQAINDKDSHLNLAAGTHRLDGEQSLGLVRTRHGVGDGSDLGRIQLQHTFIKALLDQVKSVGVLSNPTKLYRLADTATSSITTDKDLASVSDLSDLAKSLKGISSNDIQMATLPVTYDTTDGNRVIPLDSQAKQVWAALKADHPIPKSALKGSAGDKTKDAQDAATAPSDNAG